MDLTNLASLKELGIAITAIIIFGYITKYVIDTNKKVFDDLINQLKENRTDYTNFVNENNHQNTERIEKSTEAMVKVTQSIETHNRSTELYNQVLERLIAKLDK